MPGPTPEQIAAFKAKMDAHRAKADELTRVIGEATDKTSRMEACRALLQHYNSLYPCSHGQNAANGCLACDALYRAVYGFPADEGFGGPIG